MRSALHPNAAPIRLAAAFSLSISLFALAPTAAEAQARSVSFAKTGAWQVNAVYDRTGYFNHCAATAVYHSGTKVAFIAYRSGVWRLQFYKRDWPKRASVNFPARLDVDGRTVLRGKGFFKGRSAFIDLGQSSKKVIALMRGRIMAIHTPSGRSSFRLDGTFKAAIQVAKCWGAKRNTSTGGGVASNQGAFGAIGNTQPRASSIVSRARTLEFATSYLSGTKRTYTILPRNKNILKTYPVNWKFGDGVVGAMKVYENASSSAETQMQQLLARQSANCKGRNATQREQRRQLKSGSIVLSARGVCETNKGSILNMRYRVLKSRSKTLVVVVHAGLKQIFNNKVDPRRLDRPDQSTRQPAPNEL